MNCPRDPGSYDCRIADVVALAMAIMAWAAGASIQRIIASQRASALSNRRLLLLARHGKSSCSPTRHRILSLERERRTRRAVEALSLRRKRPYRHQQLPCHHLQADQPRTSSQEPTKSHCKQVWACPWIWARRLSQVPELSPDLNGSRTRIRSHIRSKLGLWSLSSSYS